MRSMKYLRNCRGKKCAVGLLAACLLVGSSVAIPAPVQAAVNWTQLAEDDQLYPGAKYTEDDARYIYILPKNATTKKGCTVVAYFGGSQSVKLPKKIGSYKITNFGTGF